MGKVRSPDPALHPRPRPRPADVAGPPGRSGAGDRGRAHQRAHPAQHPALRLVAHRGRGQGRGRGAHAGPSRCSTSTGPKVPGRAPRGAVPLRARVHPRRAAGVHGLPPPRLGHVGGVGRARRHGERGRPARHHDRRDVHRHPPPGRVGPVAGPGGAARVRPHRRRRRAGLGQVVPHRPHRLQDAADGRPLDRARPLRPAGRAHPAPRAGPVLAAHQPAPAPIPASSTRTAWSPSRGPSTSPTRRTRSGRGGGSARWPRPPVAGWCSTSSPGCCPSTSPACPHTRIVLLRAVREVGGGADRHPGLVIDVLRRHAARRRGPRGRRRRLPGGAPRAAAGRAAVPRHQPRTTRGRPTATTASPSSRCRA